MICYFFVQGLLHLFFALLHISLALHLQVLMRRRPLLYVVSLLIPSIFLMVVDIISFNLPPNTGTRISFKVSILLGYTVFRVNLMDEIPATAVTTPLIGQRRSNCSVCLLTSCILFAY